MEVRYRITKPIRLEVNFRISGLTALLGRSGEGKTTTLKALAGLIPARGSPYGGLRPEARPIGYLPQHHALFPHMTALANVAFPLQNLPPKTRKARALALLERFGLGALAGARPSELSGGQRQRVALARALARNPELLLLDEPTASLDREAREDIGDFLASLAEEEKTRILVATHDPELAQSAHWVVVLEKNRVVQEGPPSEVFTRPASLNVARLVGFSNLFPGQVSGFQDGYLLVETVAGTLWVKSEPLAPGTPVTLGIRPEEVLIVRKDRPLRVALRHNVIAGTIRRLRLQGPYVKAEFSGPLELKILLPRHVQDRLKLSPGQAVEVTLKPAYLQLFSSESFSSLS